jgi:hypothetical protein
MNRIIARRLGAVVAAAGLGVTGAAMGIGHADAAGVPFKFGMVRSANALAVGCLGTARATVTVTPTGPVETMRIVADGLPKSTDFDVFVIQVPNAPFGLSWYQGDLETDANGHGDQTYVGRFSKETFTVAPGSAAAPVRHTAAPFPDASTNPATAPVHQFHVGMWFNKPADSVKAGCQSAVTPFNGDHNAGVQAMSTRTFGIGDGPLGRVTS